MAALNCRIEKLLWEWIGEFGPLIEWAATSTEEINLLQIQNGYGKTTTMHLIQHIFSGTLPSDEIIKKKLIPKGPDYQDAEQEGRFEVTLSINDESLRIGIKFNHSTNTAEFYTVRGDTGNEPGWNPPRPFKDTFYDNLPLCRLFLFDAEIASEINREVGRETVQLAIMKLANLAPLESLSREGGHLDEYLQDRMRDADVTGTQTQINTIQNALNGAKAHRTLIIEDSERLLNENSRLDRERDGLIEERRILEIGQEAESQIAGFREQWDEIREQRDNRTAELLKDMMNPQNIGDEYWADLTEYYSHLERNKLPGPAREWFNDIAEADDCICGLPMNEEMSAHIVGQVDDMVGSEIHSVVLNIRREVRERVFDSTLEAKFAGLRTIVDDLAEIDTGIERAQRGLPEDYQVNMDRIRQRLSEIRTEMADNVETLKMFQSTDADEIAVESWDGQAITSDGTPSEIESRICSTPNIFTLNKCIENLERKRAELSGIGDLQNAVSVIKNIVNDAMNQVLQSVKEDVMQRANDTLTRLHPQGGLRIIGLDNGISVENLIGREQDGANQAGTLAITYSFVKALLDLAEVSVPIALDSPTNPFGGRVVSNFARMIPMLNNQTIMFIQSMEKAGLVYLTGELSDKVHFCTIHRSDEEVLTGTGPEGENPQGSLVINWDNDWFMDYDPPR
uniref:Rad50/SbcC-type AAA domain-containing protein n=1 Tax=uncultured marine group II/III euryarchaeote KM3_173_A11 TaxID=1457930 RepID=A0A075GMD7_9EURY|nr:hypothetical protein [uncultured marine group II/III euryarchaeote KM3_173_A11]